MGTNRLILEGARSASRAIPAHEFSPVMLTTERLHLLMLPPDAAGRVLAYHQVNEKHLGPVSPARPPTFFTLMYWRTRLAQDREDFRNDLALRFYLLPREQPETTAPVVGTVSFTHIRRGPIQACELGYGLDFRYEGKGLMTEALRAACAYAFEAMGLHRIQATHLPENLRSAAVLRRLGFAVEGYARDFLLINGRWRDHVLTSLVAPPASPEP
ncbi:GNAT family N-acetyltransferase [Stigmatella aurantiaca]|uniref:Ribosomal-protein-alanine acetyltransferase n=1 Tax=Stigmatella aurantiaca (strain DW4/3-1) TaxID=378806 RepID=Q08X93_STIAD|nr:GNAT family N-acetyltransferase [Stigmatella aurantiaca]ADO75908.1 Ribosomal protein alanine acetyltransferase [Stigmatella aurantiaca DW4/3-1]EAU65110.1 ribosomal-protein-alanine acetyltransferase [Stigmatella aurantiaca DW4/3-1]